jgi:serine/threonine protein kinase
MLAKGKLVTIFPYCKEIPMARVASPPIRKVGSYFVLEKIGDGGMGAVFKGRNSTTDAPVAIKLVSANVMADEKLRLRFAQECQVARLLAHPNIVHMLDFGLEGSTPYLVMEYVDGESLGQRLENHGPLPEHEALSYFDQIGAALEWAHEKKLVHRDVKPDNILVDGAGQAKLADLGLAKSLEENLGLTCTNTFFGTPNFMAPEQFVDAKRADAQSDLYSLAASLYMVLTGVLPFGATGGPARVYQKKVANDIQPPQQIVPGLSASVNGAILRALRADRKERPASVAEFIQLLTTASAAPAVAGSACPAGCDGNALVKPVRAGQDGAIVSGEVVSPPSAQGTKAAFAVWPFFGLVCLLPSVLGILAAGYFFHRNAELALLAAVAGPGFALLSLLLWIGRRRGPDPSRSE